MSFAAVVGLIAAWEAAREPLARWRADAGPVGRMGLAVLATAGTSLVAGMASAPYALYHFNRFAAFGLVANLLAVPLTGLWVMPWAVAAFLLLPFGLESWALIPMGWGTDGIIAIAREVAGWGGAVALLPAMPAWGLAAITLGGLWLCVWRRRWRLGGLPLIAVGLASIVFERGPDILISGDARLLAVRGGDGTLQLSSGRTARLTRETWLRRAGQEADDAPVWPALGISDDGRLRCDPSGCLYRVNGHIVALARDASALAEDCRVATVVVATVPVRRGCPTAGVVIDRFSLWRDGGHALWLEPNGVVRVENVRAHRGVRPWVPPLPTPRARRPA
jgi:competence protein ComEC